MRSAWIFNIHCLILVGLNSRTYDGINKFVCQLLLYLQYVIFNIFLSGYCGTRFAFILEHQSNANPKINRGGIKMKHIASKILVVLTVFTVMGFGVYAFADGGMGYGRHHGGRDHHGSGWNRGGYGCPGYGSIMGDLSDEDIQKMDEQREVFFKSTEDLRQKIYQKSLALESEFAKKNPDAKNAANLQKEISDFKAQIDQKRIAHLIEMKKINPNLGTGLMGPGMRGYGYGRGYKGNSPMMGYGSSSGHPCWQ
jgi:zinc resistance-associated protein